MELYVLDDLLRRVEVIDRFESLIWTERFASYGDFELIVAATSKTRMLLKTNVRVAINESMRVMIIETVEKAKSNEGASTLKVVGRSLETILEDRVAKNTLNTLNTDPKWVIAGSVMATANKVFNDICRQGKLSPWDKIPMLMPGTIYPESSIPEPVGNILWEQEPDTLYNALKNLCDSYDLGFRLIRNFDTSQLYFDIYTGSDRTSQQSVLPPVVFSPGYDNLQNSVELSTIVDSKNVAYVFSTQGSEVVYPDHVDPEVEGFERRVLLVKADDLEVAEGQVVDPAEVSTYLIQRGLEELANHRSWMGYDGELDQYGAYKYEVDYYLGDVVEMRNEDDVTSYMRVTEQIFVSDGEGDRSYPTLTVKTFVTPGTWLSWDYNQTWIEMGLTDYWSTV